MARNTDALTIGYDAKRAARNLTGLGNYSRYTIAAMSALYPQNRYLLYSPSPRYTPRLQPLLDQPGVELRYPQGALWQRMGSLWRSLELTPCLIEDGVNLYHGLSNELPLNIGASGLPSVVTIHDVIWRRVPGDYSWVDRRIYDFKYGRSARAATRVIAISERTKADVVNDFGIDPAKIDVIYQGIDPIFDQPTTLEQKQAVQEAYGLPLRFILAVGTVQSRKNQLLAVKALRALPKDVKLVIAGRRQSDYAREIDAYISSHGLSDRVMWLEGVPFDHLPALYALATVTAYASRYEGFGLPVVESIACGTPVIAATGSCLEEAGGEGAVYVHPDDADAFAAAATDIIDNSYRRERMSRLGRQHIKRFSAAAYAQATMATYMKAIVSI